MKRWITGLLLVLSACVPILLSRATSPLLLADSDTAFILKTIRERQNPLSWLTGDWPLGNHFYRPISSLSFELDNRLYGDNSVGYGITNCLLAIACVLLLFWFLRELTDKVAVATSSAMLFAYWHWDGHGALGHLLRYACLLVVFFGLLRHGFAVTKWLPATLVLYFVSLEAAPFAWLEAGVVGWLPGRTATIMSFFALISLSAYARYERLSADRVKPVTTPLDPPATKGTQVSGAAPRAVWIWPLVSILALALCLGSYEQGVMVPSLLVVCACAMRVMGYRVRWGWQAAFWLTLVVYLLLRYLFVPSDPSRYQLQALRTGPGVWLDISAYALPALPMLPGFFRSFVGLPMIFLMSFWVTVVAIFANVAAVLQVKRRWHLALPSYALSLLAFLPMAWLSRFEHYHHLPMAFRSLFVVAMGLVALDLIVIAVSPQARQAPQRLSPAPGSLPRP